jgi:CHAT domain-containing protein/1,2-phenylacetyl-CoA epoxidase PaaB subunit
MQVGEAAKDATALTQLGDDHRDRSEYEQAIAFYEQALALYREVQDRAGEGRTLTRLGQAYYALSQYKQALALSEEALAIHREVHNRRDEGITLGLLGNVYARLSQYERALALYEQALTIHRELHNRGWEGSTLRALGNAYWGLSQYEQAIALAEQALTIHREVHIRRDEAVTLVLLGQVYESLSQYEQAIALYEQALTIHREVHIRRAEGFTLANLMEGWKARGEPRLAIFYGKLAVNVYQAMRADIRGLDPELQQSFLATDQKTSAYRTLAALLITAGRLPEAQQVLDLLKEAEFFDFVRRDAQIAGGAPGRATLTPSEATWEARYQAIADHLAALGMEYGALRRQRARTAADTERLNALEADLGVARQAFEQFLAHVQAELRQAPQPSDTIHRLAEESQGLMDALRELDPGTVALHTLVSETAYRVILTTPEVQIAREFPITAADLNRLVLAFREVLAPAREGGTLQDPRPLARELYQMVVAPVAQDLQQAHAQTLLWSLDGVLRYLPLAALHDGGQYLLERYRLVVFTPASHTRLKDLPHPHWTGLGVGVSKAHEYFAALPAVPEELRSIIRDATQPEPQGVLPGTIQLDEAFTAPALRAALRESYPVVHIASHFQFRPGDETASFLLLGDGSHLTLAQLKTWPQPFQGVDLLTLSACNSALIGAAAEGTEVEGFAVLAQRQGAKAVVATLWAVADKSTQTLMQAFYRLRESQTGMPKVEALRQAQLALLRGKSQSAGAATAEVRGIDLVQAGSRATSGGLPRFTPDPQAPYAHPFYWAPFLLIGNWH